MKLRKISMVIATAALGGCMDAAPTADRAPADETIPDISPSGLPHGFASWAEVFAVQGPLDDAGREVQRVAATQPGSGFSSYELDVAGRSLRLRWRGQPSDAERAAIDAVRAQGFGVEVVAAKYSREELDAQIDLITQDAPRILRVGAKPDGSGVEVALRAAPGRSRTVGAADLAELPNLRAAQQLGDVTVVAEPPPALYTREADTAAFWGGALIRNNAGYSCTSGFAATRPSVGQAYLITASHCSDGVLGQDWYTGAGTLLGFVDNHTNAHDGMFINTTSRGSSAAIYDGAAVFASGQSFKTVVGAVHVGIGAFVCHSGALTGVRCDGIVRRFDRECSDVLGCANIVDVDSTTSTMIAGVGDSGGPVFVNTFNNSAALAVGLIHGAFGNRGSCSNPLFSRYPNQSSTRDCSTGYSFTQVIDAMAPIPGMKIKTVGGQPTVNGDDRADLLARSSAGNLIVYTNAGGSGLGTFNGTPQTVGTGWVGFNSIALADINGDGRADLFTRTSAGALLVYLNAGGSGLGTFTGTPQTVGTGWNGFDDINLGDLNRDGRADLLARTFTGELIVYLNAGGSGLGTFNGTPQTVGSGWTGFDSITLGDVNGDGRADLLARTSAGALLVYTNAGGTGFGLFNGTPQTVGTGWNGFNSIALGDVNGDGRADLLTRTSAGALLVYLNAGGTGFGLFNGTPQTVGTGWNGLDSIGLG